MYNKQYSYHITPLETIHVDLASFQCPEINKFILQYIHLFHIISMEKFLSNSRHNFSKTCSISMRTLQLAILGGQYPPQTLWRPLASVKY